MAQNYLSYTSRDFNAIKTDLINAIPSMTDIWTNRDAADPGMVLITLMAALGDSLNFNMDQQSLEFYGKTMTQRKSAIRVLDLIGYKLHWYKSATLELTVHNNHPTNKLFMVFNPHGANTQSVHSSTVSNSPKYFILNPNETIDTWNQQTTIEIPAGSAKTFNAVQGILRSVTFDASNIDINNRYYLPVTKVDQSNLWLHDSAGYQWYITNNVNTLTKTEPRFEFGVDEYNLPYIELVPYWESAFGSVHTFTLHYLATSGSNGNVSANILTTVTGLTSHSLNKTRISREDVLVTHGANTVPNTNLANVPGADPQSAQSAYFDSRNYIGTYNTLVTLRDFENFMRRFGLISAARAVDGQYAKEYNDTLPTDKAYNKLVPVSYIANSYQLTDGKNIINVLPDDSVTDFYSTTNQSPLSFSDSFPAWSKADSHNYSELKKIEIISEGHKDVGALAFVHNGSAGDLKVRFNNDIGLGNKRIDFYIKLENITGKNSTDITTDFSSIKLFIEQDDFESEAIDLLSVLDSDNGKDARNRISKYLTESEDIADKYTTEKSVQFTSHSNNGFILRLHCDLATGVTEPTLPIRVILDNMTMFNTDGSESNDDLLDGAGDFCTKKTPVTVYSCTINKTKHYFDVNEDGSIHRATTSLDNWDELVDNDYILLPLNAKEGEAQSMYLFQASDENFAPYSVQMHMVAGDFLLAGAATGSTYAYATETPVEMSTNELGEPCGYISYQLTDNVVGESEDSMISQSKLQDIKLFNTEVTYGPIRKFPFFIDGQIHLNAPVSPSEANLILGRIYAALQTYFNAYNLNLGEKITFNKVIAVIKSADSRISYFDAGANNEHGSLFIYPNTSDYNPHDYNSVTYQYGKYKVNIDPTYFNDISMQHYEDLLQANNSLIYWGDTLSGHLSIAKESLSEKSTPITTGIKTILQYDDFGRGVVRVVPDVANLYEYNIFENVMVDTNHKMVTSIPNTLLVRDYAYMQKPAVEGGMYTAVIPKVALDVGDASTISQRGELKEKSIMFTISDKNTQANHYLVGWYPQKNGGCYVVLNDNSLPTVGTELDGIKIESDNNNYYVKIDSDLFDVNEMTKIFFLRTYSPQTAISYSNIDKDNNVVWTSDNIFSNIGNFNKTTYYEMLVSSDNIWQSNQDYITLSGIDCDGFTYICDRYTDGYAAATRAKETITSTQSAVMVSNYAFLSL